MTSPTPLGDGTPTPPHDPVPPSGRGGILDFIERVGNRLPDPAALFLILLFAVWGISALVAPLQFTEIDPRSDAPIQVKNMLAPAALAAFLGRMVTIFTSFHPLGVVLVALLGVGVAEYTGFINAGLKSMLAVTSAKLLTPMLILVACLSHTAADAGYVLVIPLGGVIFFAAGRHPLAGIAAAFAGVSGGFSANFIPSSIDPLLAGLSQEAARIVAPERTVNPLANLYFTGVSTLLIVGLGWFLTDRVVEPRLRRTAVDGDVSEFASLGEIGPRERRGLRVALLAMLLAVGLLALAAWFPGSTLRSPTDRSLTRADAPLMQGIVPLIFIFFLIPGVVYGYVAGTIDSHKDVIKGMSKAMSTMGYYIVMAFFASLFIAAFNESNLGALLALKGATALGDRLPPQIIIVGIILLTATVNLFVGSASAKWALLGPIFVPMLMALGLSPELTQAAYRVGDSSTNIITPLMPYFPLVVVFCQRYVRGTGIGTLVSIMLPYSMTYLVAWTLFLLAYWQLGIPLGIDAPYTYPP